MGSKKSLPQQKQCPDKNTHQKQNDAQNLTQRIVLNKNYFPHTNIQQILGQELYEQHVKENWKEKFDISLQRMHKEHGWTNAVLINNKHKSGTVKLYLPAYLVINLQEFTEMNIQNMSSIANMEYSLKLFYGSVPQKLIKRLIPKMWINFQNDQNLIYDPEDIDKVKMFQRKNSPQVLFNIIKKTTFRLNSNTLKYYSYPSQKKSYDPGNSSDKMPFISKFSSNSIWFYPFEVIDQKVSIIIPKVTIPFDDQLKGDYHFLQKLKELAIIQGQDELDSIKQFVFHINFMDEEQFNKVKIKEDDDFVLGNYQIATNLIKCKLSTQYQLQVRDIDRKIFNLRNKITKREKQLRQILILVQHIQKQRNRVINKDSKRTLEQVQHEMMIKQNQYVEKNSVLQILREQYNNKLSSQSKILKNIKQIEIFNQEIAQLNFEIKEKVQNFVETYKSQFFLKIKNIQKQIILTENNILIIKFYRQKMYIIQLLQDFLENYELNKNNSLVENIYDRNLDYQTYQHQTARYKLSDSTYNNLLIQIKSKNQKLSIKDFFKQQNFSKDCISKLKQKKNELNEQMKQLIHQFQGIQAQRLLNDSYLRRFTLLYLKKSSVEIQQMANKQWRQSFNKATIIIPIYREPLVSIAILFIPIWVLTIINLCVFFQPVDLGNRIVNISTLMISYVTYFQLVRNQLGKFRQILLIQILLYLQLIFNMFCLIQTIVFSDSLERLTINEVGPLFFISFGFSMLSFFIVIFVLIYYKIFLKPTYIANEQLFFKQNILSNSMKWKNYECDLFFQKKQNQAIVPLQKSSCPIMELKEQLQLHKALMRQIQKSQIDQEEDDQQTAFQKLRQNLQLRKNSK